MEAVIYIYDTAPSFVVYIKDTMESAIIWVYDDSLDSDTENALLNADGSPILNADGSYILTQ